LGVWAAFSSAPWVRWFLFSPPFTFTEFQRATPSRQAFIFSDIVSSFRMAIASARNYKALLCRLPHPAKAPNKSAPSPPTVFPLRLARACRVALWLPGVNLELLKRQHHPEQ
jgi:hypothetical protein